VYFDRTTFTLLPPYWFILLKRSITSRYRHYGVYVTHEEDQLVDDDDVLRNPVVVLDRNSESYINLRYPVLAPPPPLTKCGALESEVCATSFKIKFEDSV